MRKRKQPTLSSLKKKCWKLFSEYIRRKDADEGGTVECFTSGKLMHWKEAHAGHAIPGRHNAVLFDESIVKPQSPVDNIWKGGQYHIFATKLIKEHGMEWWEEKLIASRRVVKYTAADLEEKIESLKKKLEKLNERDRTPRDFRREESPQEGKAERGLEEVERQSEGSSLPAEAET